MNVLYRIGRWIGGLGVFIALGATAHAQQEQPLTLSGAVQYALKHSETVLMSEQDIEKTRGQVKSALSQALPNLSLNGFYQRSWRVPTSVISGRTLRFGSTNTLNGNATLTIPLYQGGQALAARRVAQAANEVAESNLTNVRQQVAFDTQQAFYAVLLADALVAVNESALHQAEAHLNQVRRFLKVGTASEYDALRAQVQVSTLRPDVITAKNNRAMALLDLKRTIGMDLGASVTVVGSLEEVAAKAIPVAKTIDTAVGMAMKNRPDVAAMEYQIEMLEDAVRVQAGAKRPSANIVNRYQTQAQVDDINSLSRSEFIQSYSSRVVFDIPVFDGFRSRGAVHQARADLLSARFSERQRRKQVELEARQAFMRVGETHARLQAQQEAVSQAEKGLEIAEVRYRAGVGTQLEIIDAQLVVTQTRSAYAQAMNDYAVAVASLHKAVGLRAG